MTVHRHEAYRKVEPDTLWPNMGRASRERSTRHRYTLRMVPVADIVRNLSSSVDVGCGADVIQWIVDAKIWDDSTWTLIDYFLEGTDFVIPVCIVVDDDDEWEMGNGHHRLVAEILTMAHEEIPVLFSLDGGYMHDWITTGRDEGRSVARDDAPEATILDPWAVDADTELAYEIAMDL